MQYEKVKGGYSVEVPAAREAEFKLRFPKAKQRGDSWVVPTREMDDFEQWAGEDTPAPAERDDVETDDLRAIELQLENVGPDMVRKRILNRQRENLIAERAQRKRA